ncbi:MAG: hypothetical protein JWN18_293 [Parcubacteria group bacterium]|nr:hypothetical protein [Parcubacteria group bacterium]
MKTNTILIIVASLVVAAGAYWFFFSDTGNEPPIIADSGVNNENQAQFEALLSQLPIAFDTSVFTDPRFNLLVDITTAISPETIGKTDPFAPVAGAASNAK